MRQLRPETGESLPIFQNTDPIAFVLFISLFLTYCIKEGIKSHPIREINVPNINHCTKIRQETR